MKKYHVSSEIWYMDYKTHLQYALLNLFHDCLISVLLKVGVSKHFYTVLLQDTYILISRL